MNLKNKPDFIGVGSEKAATGWIFESLNAHPEICGSSPKEINFFNESYKYRKGLNFYLSHFSHCSEDKVKGEISPAYFSSPQVPFLIHKYFPDIKIIICLRNPIEKIYSLYRFHVKVKQRLSIYDSFETAVKYDKRLIEQGFYYKIIVPYFKLFPKKNIFVLFYEDLKKDPVKFIQTVYKFLNLKDVKFIPPTINQKVNVTEALKFEYKIPILSILYFRFVSSLIKKNYFKDRNNLLIKILNKFNLMRLITMIIQWNRKSIYRYMHIEKNYVLNKPYPCKETLEFLKKIYLTDIEKLENLLNKDLSFWK